MRDTRTSNSIEGVVQVCYLVEESKHITSNTFKVFIPNLMSGINNAKGDYDERIDSKKCLNKTGRVPTSIKCQGYVTAYNMTGYGHRLDGWIPHFKIKKMTAKTGTVQKQSGNLSSGTQPAGCGPHTHSIANSYDASGNDLKEIVYNEIDMYTSTEVDLQNIHNKVIKKGHRMLGVFVSGHQLRFEIIAIDHVSPRKDDTATRSNGDYTDVTIDGAKNPQNAKG